MAYLNGPRVRASSAANTSNWMEDIATYSGSRGWRGCIGSIDFSQQFRLPNELKGHGGSGRNDLAASR
jgi:hypothetical protein